MEKIFLSILVVFLLILAVSCNRNYTCVCTNLGGPQDAFSTNSKKSKAVEECKDYYEINYGYYFSETYCEIK